MARLVRKPYSLMEELLLMSCGLQSEWRNNLINSSITPMEMLALQWKVSTLQWKASTDSDGNTKALRWKITPHNITTGFLLLADIRVERS
jgi:hypothetical protein